MTFGERFAAGKGTIRYEHFARAAVGQVSSSKNAHFSGANQQHLGLVYVAEDGLCELDSHVAGGTWRGKAGSYGIQDPETEFATLKEGACDTVVGLHVATVRRLITALSGG